MCVCVEGEKPKAHSVRGTDCVSGGGEDQSEGPGETQAVCVCEGSRSTLCVCVCVEGEEALYQQRRAGRSAGCVSEEGRRSL